MQTALRAILIASVIACTAGAALPQSLGALEVSGRVNISGKQEKLTRKRFFLLRGGLEANKQLIERMKTASFTSRDCFYCSKKASPELIAWLKAGDCETPFCRAVTEADAKSVPEFSAAVAEGTRQYRGKSDVALKWLTTSLPEDLLNGLYKSRRSTRDTILGGVTPIQSSMTDSVSVKAIFIDVPLNLPAGKTSETFLVSNIVPLEFGGRSFLWACEVALSPGKKATLPLRVPEAGKSIKGCEVLVKPLQQCSPGTCESK